ncbi:hypothetical protein Tco_0299083 [Tanacetum coccineum]
MELEPNRSVLPLIRSNQGSAQTFVSTDWRHPWDQTLRTLPKSRMTKQGNFTQRTPQAKKQSDQASKQVSKQASGSTKYATLDLDLPMRRDLPGTTIQPTAQLQARKIYGVGFHHPTSNGAKGPIAPSRHQPNPSRNKTPAPSCKRKQKRDQARAYRPDLTLVRRTKYLHRATERKGAERIQFFVRDRLDSRDVHSRLGQWRSPSESPPSSDPEDSRRKRRRRNKYRGDEDEDMSRPWRRQKVDAFTRRISDFSEDKKRRMPANVKTYDGTGPSFKEKPPPRTAEKATLTTGHRTSPGDNPMTRVAVATTATAVRGAGGGTTSTPH